MAQPPIRIVYDGDCPFCKAYVRLVRLRENFTVELVDARARPDEVARIAGLGLSLDEGMLVEIGERRWHGGEAMRMLATLTSESGPWNRLYAFVFGSERRAALLYPPLRAIRNLTLRLLGRRRIDGTAF
ncbi:MAG: DCC1-like thiol-disulfide oxidoreductase family protein [Reyranellaceae bacterium]